MPRVAHDDEQEADVGTPSGTAWIVAGESLVDLAVEADGRLRPTPGGSPYNVAIGLGRLEVPTGYLGPRSTDGFGVELTDRLVEAEVDLALAAEVDAPTTLAVVHLDAQGRASYGFYLEGTAAASLRSTDLPGLPAGAGLHVSFGAIGVRSAPSGSALVALVRRESGRRLVSLDPNLRPTAVGDDVGAYAAALDDLVTSCDVVKASDEDLAVLGDPEEVAARWAASGPALVVITRGPDGATALTATGRHEVPGRHVEVIDTVGAGDAFTAGLLAALHDAGATDRESLVSLAASPGALGTALDTAVAVAAITCTRPGSDPPTRAELDAPSG